MPQLIVRNIEENVVRKLKKRAGDQGISTEEAHRRILRSALFPGAPKNRDFIDHLLSVPKASPNEPKNPFRRGRDTGREVKL